MLPTVSMVYNLRIAQITKQPLIDHAKNKKHTPILLLFDQYHKKYSAMIQNYPGFLGAYIYNYGLYYGRIDMAVAGINKSFQKSTLYAGTQTDDILFTFGKNWMLKPAHQNPSIITLSGLCGLPTHKVYELVHPQFGIAQMGLGLQLDSSWGFNQTSALLVSARYLYFVPRKARDYSGKHYKLTIDNFADVLIACKNRWALHGMELGYTARCAWGAHIIPYLKDFGPQHTYTRSNFYAVYKYIFSIKETTNRLLFNIAYGFDHQHKKYNNKYILTTWASWSINF